MTKKYFDERGIARQKICEILSGFDLDNLSQQDKEKLKVELEAGRPIAASFGPFGSVTVPQELWTQLIEKTMFRLGILKPELPDIKGPIVCDPIGSLEPVPAGKGKDPDRVQLPLPLF